MTDAPLQWLSRLIARSSVQARVARWPLGGRLARRDGDEIFDILQGFVKSQTLLALIELDILERLLDAPATAEQLGLVADIPVNRMARLLAAGAAIGLLKRQRGERYRLARRGAAILGVPGLMQMIRHNAVLYRDMADPVRLLRGGQTTELSQFWPYVFGAGGEVDAETAARYSKLMADSQQLVAQDTLRMVDLRGVGTLLDVGGGSGAFLRAALRHCPDAHAILFDLPEVMPSAEKAFDVAGLSDRVTLIPGSFRSEALPLGADVITLVRVLYDHEDDTVKHLISKVYEALPRGGRLIISEPMSGGERPEPAGDVYFNFYTMAMGTGQVRSANEIGQLCADAGFVEIRMPRAPRPFVTSVVTCAKPV
ncbi:acetylserotonin O-methyltransferase [Roseovarius faecimaris]|uniref:acetylserotonin O-methyltransferase n=1 Tax=Roseovarius faecimaris TaxID=2494550 RepID=UPI001FEB5A18|nr:acetylserotonin O-methyltransferase [Roseovarius faecimaris]